MQKDRVVTSWAWRVKVHVLLRCKVVCAGVSHWSVMAHARATSRLDRRARALAWICIWIAAPRLVMQSTCCVKNINGMHDC